MTLWATQHKRRSWSALLAASVSLIGACVLCLLSYLEHARNVRPSSILVVYLLFSTILDVARCRTLWLVAGNTSLARIFTASVVLKAILLVPESWEKAKFLPASMRERRPEETSSILNRSIFYWLNRLMIQGSRHILRMDNLYKLDDEMTADTLGSSYLRHWRNANQAGQNAALLTLVKTLKWYLLAPIIPRAILLVLTVCQPVLLHKLLTYLSAPAGTTSGRTGLGIVAAYAFVYTGSAIATGFYWHQQYRFLTMARGCLVSAIGWKTASLDILAASDPKAAVSLMSTDVERITDGMRPLHDFWASIIQIAISLYLLEQQMGVACVVPVVLSIICAAITAWTSRLANRRQIKWMEAIQDRIGLTSVMLSSMKSARMRGIVNVMAATIQDARAREISHANRWRWLMLITVGLSFVPEYLSPMSTSLVYVLQAKAAGGVFDVSRAFTTLSLLTIMTQPLNNLLQSVPGLVGAGGCLVRIGQFLSSNDQQDFRDIEKDEFHATGSTTPTDAPNGSFEVMELRPLPAQPSSNMPPLRRPIVRITNGCFGWGQDDNVLSDINITMLAGDLTCIIGPVASGKSTLCHTILGETHASKGRVQLFTPSRKIAFCHQTAYLINGTIRENIIGFSDADARWYQTVLRACALEEDVDSMPKQNDTVVGSGGFNLSGGQRHKVALARAIYAREKLLVLDDIFSGLDAHSEQHVFREVVGPHGLARKHNITVILATHAVKFLPYADHIIALGANGKIEQEGSFDELRSRPGYTRNLTINNQTHHQKEPAADTQVKVEGVGISEQVAQQDLSRQLGNFAIYRYYLRVAGLTSTALMLFYVIASAAFFNVSTFWLKLWTDASSSPGNADDYRYVGIYALFQCLALLFDLLLIYQLFIDFATTTGLQLHSRLLHAVANATLHLFSTTDNGLITNHFSQDMQLIDSQLPLGLVNLTFSFFVAIGQATLIVVASPWVGLTLPIILGVFYAVQKFYLQTSRQMRFLDLEAKTPLYTNFLETLGGLATIRAFGWTKPNLVRVHRLLDNSQMPVYLLYMIQRWLTFVLDMIVAILAVLIAAIAVIQRSDSGFAGVALTQVLLINLTLRSIIVSWTEVETCIGSVSRLKRFGETTDSEHKPQENKEPPIDWPCDGKLEFNTVTAIYESSPDQPALRGVNLLVHPGEKIGICGRSGSGKSSLVLSLLRMTEIQSGSIKVDDLDLQEIPRNTVRRRVNVIPQDAILLPTTVRANLDPFNETEPSAMIEALKMVDLWTFFDSKGGLDAAMQSDFLSHGQRQLFSLASAVLRKSKIVVLDEATSK